MSLRVANLHETPPGYWRYQVPETGKTVGPFPALSELYSATRKYYEVNEMLAPADLDVKIHDFMCHQIHPSLCEDAETSSKLLNPSTKSKLAQFNSVVTGTLTIGEWFIKGRLLGQEKLVDKEQALNRGLVCSTCPNNVQVGRCAPCVSGRLTKAVERVVGNASLPIDGKLNACNLCGCSLKAKVWFPVKLLRKHMTALHLAQFPDFCWLTTEP